MTGRQQMDSLGIGASAYNGLVVIEIDGPPIVALTPHEARRFYTWFKRAYRDALRDQDCNPDTARPNRKVEVQTCG